MKPLRLLALIVFALAALSAGYWMLAGIERFASAVQSHHQQAGRH